MKAVIAKKLGMTSTINDNGAVNAVTLLLVETNTVTQIKNLDIDGYNAVQVGAGEAKLNKSATGHYKTSKANPRIVREFIIDESGETEDLKVGDKISPEVFSVGDTVNVTGTSKGKGFAGTIKRHNFHRGRKTHGGRSYRRPGSIGSMYPQRIFKGKKMAGQMGHVQVTTKNLKVALVDVEHNVIGLTGAVPGPRKGTVLIRGAK